MDMLVICRICLIEDVRMQSLHYTELQDTFERLTAVCFEDKDKPLQLCYMCYAKLRNCYELQRQCLQSDELLTQRLFNKKMKLPPQNANRLKIVHPMINFSIPTLNHNELDICESPAIKMEPGEMIYEESVKEEPCKGINVNTPTLAVLKDVPQACYSSYQVKYEDKKQKANDKPTEQKDDPSKVSVSTNSNQPKCDMSERYYCNKSNLLKHNCVHTGENPQKCHSCQKKFECDSNLKIHSPIKTDDNPYECNICTKRFKSRCGLRYHLRKHAEGKVYICEICGKHFVERFAFSFHISVAHSRKIPYKCDICGEKFRSKSTLRKHISVIHKYKKLYKCDICDQRFCHKLYLKNHYVKHTGERRYSCDTCMRDFINKCGLVAHIRYCHENNNYKCDVCAKSFRHKSKFKIHRCCAESPVPKKSLTTCPKSTEPKILSSEESPAFIGEVKRTYSRQSSRKVHI